jgi:predicted nucleic acid-binding protein
LVDYFADSFAFIAHFEGNDRYVRIFERKDLATTALNVLEVYATLLRRVEVDEARRLASALLPHVVEVPPEVAFPAGQFRLEMRRRRKDCSYIDAWGYATSRHLGVPFLTGDPAFRSVDHVSFVR